MADVGEMRERREALVSEARALVTEHDTLEGEALERFEALEADIARLDADIERHERIARLAAAGMTDRCDRPPTPIHTGAASSPHEHAARHADRPAEVRSAAVDALGAVPGIDEGRAAVVADLIRSDDSDVLARVHLAKSDPHHLSGWLKRVTRPDLPQLLTPAEAEAMYRAEIIRAALSVGSAGSVLVPTAIDPTLILTNAGAGPASIRTVAREVITSGSAWYGVTSAGVTASMDAEGAEVSDDTPTVSQATATLRSARAFVEWTVEVEQDQGALVEELRRALADARFNLEESQLATGTGTSPEVTGWITALDGTASELAPATAETFALGDVFDTQAAVPTRALMSPSVAWVMHPGTALKIRELVQAAGGAEGVWTDTAVAQPSLLNGVRVVYSDKATNVRDLDATVTATNNAVVTCGDWSRFVIADHAAGAVVELVPHVFGANQRPTGTRGLFMMWRFGTALVDTGAFRMLSVPTTA